MNIIGISGKIGSGKGTVTNMLLKIDTTYREIFFAYKLKKFVTDLAGVDFELSLSQEGKNVYIESFNMTLGEMLQKIGTDAMRDNFDEDVWIKATLNGLDTKYNYIISDLRFKNEANYLKSKGHVTLKIIRPNNDINDLSKRNTEHKSETELDDFEFDYVIVNDGDLQDLYHKVLNFYTRIFNI